MRKEGRGGGTRDGYYFSRWERHFYFPEDLKLRENPCKRRKGETTIIIKKRILPVGS